MSERTVETKPVESFRYEVGPNGYQAEGFAASDVDEFALLGFRLRGCPDWMVMRRIEPLPISSFAQRVDAINDREH
jgi:hypothetical protein